MSRKDKLAEKRKAEAQVRASRVAAGAIPYDEMTRAEQRAYDRARVAHENAGNLSSRPPAMGAAGEGAEREEEETGLTPDEETIFSLREQIAALTELVKSITNPANSHTVAELSNRGGDSSAPPLTSNREQTMTNNLEQLVSYLMGDDLYVFLYIYVFVLLGEA